MHNILLVAPHGNMKDDIETARFALSAREHLDCSAIINTRFRKGMGGVEFTYGIADLYKRQGFLHPEVKALFWEHLLALLDSILASHEKALVLHIHGIKDLNIQKIAALKNGDPLKSHHVPHVVIGYGQHFKNPRYTADED
jgi:hypothetical protein